jgi:hypothetical protein
MIELECACNGGKDSLSMAAAAMSGHLIIYRRFINISCIWFDRRDAMIELECACDGGKDSLSMAAAAGGETVMAPGNLVVSAYVGCPDITKVVTPDLKMAAAGGVLLHVDLASVPGARRLGGSALAQAYSQVGTRDQGRWACVVLAAMGCCCVCCCMWIWHQCLARGGWEAAH